MDLLSSVLAIREDFRREVTQKAQAVARGIQEEVIAREPAITGNLLASIVIAPEGVDPESLFTGAPSGMEPLGNPGNLMKPDAAAEWVWKKRAMLAGQSQAQAINWKTDSFSVTSVMPYAPEVENSNTRFGGRVVSGFGPSMAFHEAANWARSAFRS